MMQTDCKNEALWALGLMSGTSLDGVDAALINTDGTRVFAHGENLTLPYSADERAMIMACIEQHGDVAATADMLTRRHREAVEMLLDKSAVKRANVKVIGFHGQTILHAPERGITQQIGNPQWLADTTGIDVVADFRSRDVAEGGQGAPLVPLYHAALMADSEQPVVVVNIGGVANVTYIDGETIIACDTGPGNALIDDWVFRHTGATFDEGGKIAACVVPNNAVVQQLMAHPFFNQSPPKSLDRNSFAQFVAPFIESMELGEGAATLTAFTADSIAAIANHFPTPAKRWLIAGGGRNNYTIIRLLSERLDNIGIAEAGGINGDALEAEAFAFLAVRSLRGLPLSLPTTTGVKRPTTGGKLFYAK